uniref:Neugrin n=1 Tax=Leptobrachium leishanense TaxID=445787 RepID=A0A8C5LZL4_9ANUR
MCPKGYGGSFKAAEHHGNCNSLCQTQLLKAESEPVPPAGHIINRRVRGALARGPQTRPIDAASLMMSVVCGVTALWRLRRGFSHTVATGLRVFAGTGSGRFHSSQRGEDEFEGDFETEEDGIEAIKSSIQKQQKAIKFQRMRREFEPRGPPERKLSWSAMEQIRYLKREFPEEWTLHRLAEGFNVSSDVIQRVLRSNFSPPEKRRLKQDLKVSKVLGQNVIPDTRKDVALLPQGTKDSGVRLLQPGLRGTQNIPQKSIPPPGNSQSAALALRTEDALVQRKTERTQLSTQHFQHSPAGVIPTAPQAFPADDLQADPTYSLEVQQDNDDEEWDGEVLSDGELEELAEQGIKNHLQVVQKGREFFDNDGKFLYRI